MTKEENREILLKCKKEFFIKIITSILVVGLLLLIPIFYSRGIDYINNGSFKKAYIIFVVLGFSSLLYRLLETINQKAYYFLYSKLYKNYADRGIEKTCNNSLYSLSRFSLSEYSNILSEDFELLSDYYSTLIIRIVEIFQFIYIIIYFFFINQVIGYITLILSIVVIFLLFYFNKFIVKINEVRKNRNDLRISLFQEIFLAIREIKGFNILKSLKNDINENIDTYVKWNNKLNIAKYNLRQSTLGIVDVFKVVSLIYGVYLIMHKQITIGVLTIIYNYYTKLSELFTSIILLNESLSNVKVAKKRIFKLFQYANDKIVVQSDKNDILGHISFLEVLYGNRNNPTLNNVTFTINPCSFNVLIGSSKAAKGVFDLLLKYNRKHNGYIYIDDLEIENYSHENISEVISLMMEKPIFFHKSIKDNLLLFDNNFENIISVCKYLEIDSLILNLPDGYETLVDINNLDNDLYYMLSLVKVFLKKSKIILVEDIFDHLSKNCRQKILKLLLELKTEHTIILITKDQKIIRNKQVDQVLMFDKNRLIVQGLHSELYKNDQTYRNTLQNM